ncbi:hypothetical protein [Isoptericola croceus]|uniref:hypothetical protein n=1 Tax=Isoptericola croceus TaxID=3031406 RepID=UPI0023F995BC|nr:hypothetical protein [Isoptericola croceus]
MSLAAEIAELRRRRAARPLPAVRIEHGRAVPGWTFRIGATFAVAGLLAGAGSRSGLVDGVVVAVTIGLTVWAAVRPGRTTGHLAVLVAGLFLLGSPAAPFDPAALWLAPLAYLAVRLGWWAERAGRRSRVETAALWRSGRRDVAVVGATVAIGGLASVATGTPVAGLVLLGGAALLALAWWLLPR